jgi:hypothetical protein
MCLPTSYISVISRIALLVICFAITSCGNHLQISDVQSADLNKYFTLEKTKNGFTNKINSIRGDKVSVFIDQHKMRFDYLSFKTMMKLFPMKETELSQKEERYRSMVSSRDFYTNFLSLTGTLTNPLKPGFSKTELMLVASRFFYCDKVNPDSSVSYHICVGINGQHLIVPTRDLTSLEAFAIEAIFYYMDHDKDFFNHTNKNVREISEEERRSYTDKSSYLTRVRDRCFALIEKDAVLEKILLK